MNNNPQCGGRNQAHFKSCEQAQQNDNKSRLFARAVTSLFLGLVTVSASAQTFTSDPAQQSAVATVSSLVGTLPSGHNVLAQPCPACQGGSTGLVAANGVPLPDSGLLLGAGAVAIAIARRRKK